MAEFYSESPASDGNSFQLDGSAINSELSARKLFVGQVPRNVDETILSAYFIPFGQIEELVILRNRQNGAHRGCAFVTYIYPQSAVDAVISLHNRVTLPNSANPMQVRVRYKPHVSQSSKKLFVGLLPRQFTETDVKRIFAQYEPITEIFIVRDHRGESKGCAFVKLTSDDLHDSAILNLNGVRISFRDASDSFETSGIVVRYADPPSPHRVNSHPTSNSSPPTTVRTSFDSSFNYIQPVQLPESFMSTHESTPLLVSSPVYISHLHPSSSSVSPHINMESSSSSPVVVPSSLSSALSHQRTGPHGANLFIYHIPSVIRDSELLTLFNHFGQVLSCKVFIDKITKISKGFGFVSFSTVESANKAIGHMNGFEIEGKRLKVELKKEHASSPSSLSSDDMEASQDMSLFGSSVAYVGFSQSSLSSNFEPK